MKRRELFKSAMAAGLGASFSVASAAAQTKQHYLTLEWFRSRNDLDTQRLRDFLGNGTLPAYNRAGVKPVGLFQISVGPDSPSVLMLAQYPSLAGLEQARVRLEEDKKWAGELSAFDEKWELAYERRESWLLRAFKTFPTIEIPKVEGGKTNLFELRMYESRNAQAHERKVAMFDGGEIDIFRLSLIHISEPTRPY